MWREMGVGSSYAISISGSVHVQWESPHESPPIILADKKLSSAFAKRLPIELSAFDYCDPE